MWHQLCQLCGSLGLGLVMKAVKSEAGTLIVLWRIYLWSRTNTCREKTPTQIRHLCTSLHLPPATIKIEIQLSWILKAYNIFVKDGKQKFSASTKIRTPVSTSKLLVRSFSRVPGKRKPMEQLPPDDMWYWKQRQSSTSHACRSDLVEMLRQTIPKLGEFRGEKSTFLGLGSEFGRAQRDVLQNKVFRTAEEVTEAKPTPKDAIAAFFRGTRKIMKLHVFFVHVLPALLRKVKS